MFKLFEKALNSTGLPQQPEPPASLSAFYWHFARQAKGLFILLFITGFIVALLDATIPVFIGRVVTLVTASQPDKLFAESLPILLGMAAVLLIGRPLALTAQNLVMNQAIAANVANMIRWQSHWHVVRQSWPFFQNDFAGRIANRVMQTAHALRESVMASIRAVWYIGAYGVMAYALMAVADWRLGVPTLLWFASYLLFLRHFVPRMRDLARETHLVGDDHHRHALARELDHDVEHLVDHLGVERRGRLVEQHRDRIHAKRARDRHALLLAARELARILVLVREEADALQELQAFLARLVVAAPQDLHLAQHQVLRDGHVRKELEVLEHHADARAQLRQVGLRVAD